MSDVEKVIEDGLCVVPDSIRSRRAEIEAMLQDIKVIDPAAGNGIMLITFLQELVRARMRILDIGTNGSQTADITRSVALYSLFGVDVDAVAVGAARAAITRVVELACGSMSPKQKEAIASHVIVGNSLSDMRKYFHPGSFDIVVSNPPFLSYYGNAPARLIETEKGFILPDYTLVDRGQKRINAMNLFLELGMKLLKPGGILSYVLNKTLCVLPSFKRTRSFILSHSTINRVLVDLDPFDAIVDCAVLCLTNHAPSSDYTLGWCSLKGRFVDSPALASIISRQQIQISVTMFHKHKHLEFTYSVHEPILEKMELAERKMKDLIIINRGINIGGCSEHFLSPITGGKRYGKIILDARNVRHYRATWDESQGYFIFDQEKERVLRAMGKTLVLGNPRRYDGPRLFIPEASKGIRASYIDHRLYSAYGILVGKSKHGEAELKIACALLNSRAISFYAIERGILRTGKKATPHAGVKGIAELPVPTFSREAQVTVLKLVDAILAAPPGQEEERNGIPPDTGRVMEEIDRVIYEAFHLETSDVRSIDEAIRPIFK